MTEDNIEKGRTKSGVYADTYENRKKGIVGKPYKKESKHVSDMTSKELHEQADKMKIKNHEKMTDSALRKELVDKNIDRELKEFKERKDKENLEFNSALGDRHYGTISYLVGAVDRLVKPENHSILKTNTGFVLTTNKRASQFIKNNKGTLYARITPNGRINLEK